MPIYEYHCNKCENDFEIIQFSRDDIPSCPACGAKEPIRKMSSFGFSAGSKFKSSANSGSSGCSGCSSSNCSSCS